MITIIATVIVSFLIALILGLFLGIFKKLFAVPVDKKVEEIRNLLSGGNCGGCGFAGCDDFAKAVAEGRASPDGCTAGGASVATAIGKILGVDVDAVSKVAFVACRGSKECAKDKGIYRGLKSCSAAKLSIGGTKMCTFGCIGFGDCEEVCSFDALKIGEDGLPSINYSKCTGCSKCVKTCPNGLLQLTPKGSKGAIALCQNRTLDKPSILKNCKNGCIKCGKCERECPEEALKLINEIPVIDYEKCTSCKKCVDNCPTHVLILKEDLH